MMFVKRYHTASGSTYDVKTLRGAGADETYVRRHRLGQLHFDKGAEQVAKRRADGLDEGWTRVAGFECHGVGYRMIIVIKPDDDAHTLVTGPVTRIEENP